MIHLFPDTCPEEITMAVLVPAHQRRNLGKGSDRNLFLLLREFD